jgi:cytochrome c-type biogenesis protein CcmH
MEQKGALTAAHAMLTARLALADEYYPWMDSYVGLANFIAPNIDEAPLSLADYAPALRGPSTEDVANAADLSDEERGAFITSMVERLATRLADEPDDLDGWLQLARAYTVLGKTSDARDAYTQASGLIDDLPDTDPRRAAIETGLAAKD